MNAFMNSVPAFIIVVFILLLCVRNARLGRALRSERRQCAALHAEHATCPKRPDDPAVASAGVAKMVADLGETFAPVSEWVEGERARLEAEGWSPTIAEQRAFMLYAEGMSRAGGHIRVRFGTGDSGDGEHG